MTDNDFSIKTEKSLTIEDVGVLTAYMRAFTGMPSPQGGYLHSGASEVVSSEGYLIAEIWWQPEVEKWVADITNFGDAR